MSKLYDALRKLEAERAPGVPSRLDAVRLAQFLDVQDEVLRARAEPAALAPRLAHAIAVVLRLPGAGIALLEGGRYRLLAAHGAGGELLLADHGQVVADTAVARAFATWTPLVVAPPLTGPHVSRVVLPFRGDPSGVVELLIGAESPFSPDDVALGRVVAMVTGLALGAGGRPEAAAADR